MTFAKALVPLALTFIYSLQAAWNDNVISGSEWQVIGGGILAAILTYLVPNRGNSNDPDSPILPGREI